MDTSRRHAWVEEIMGMPISIHIRGRAPRDPRVEPYIKAAFAELTWVDETFSRWRADSHLSRIRRGELSVEEAAPEVAGAW